MSPLSFDEKYLKSTPIVSNKGFSRSNASANSKTKPPIVEPEIDMDKVPIVQGSFEVTKTDADITHKKSNNFPKTSTLRPFTITNGGVRMKPKKTTIEKVKPLPKIPENLTANILKLENVTIPYNIDRTTTSRYSSAEEVAKITTTTTTTTTTTPATMILISMAPTKAVHTLTTTTTTAAPPITTTPVPTTTTMTTPSASIPPSTDNIRSRTAPSVLSSSTSTTSTTTAPSTTTSQPITHSTISIPLQTLPPTTTARIPVTNTNNLVTTGEVTPTDPTLPRLDVNLFTSAPQLDNQPWHPINPTEPAPINITKKSDLTEIPAHTNPFGKNPLNNPDLIGFKLLPRNKIRPPVSPLHKTKRPGYFQGYSHPAFMYSTHEVERLGTGPVKPYPLPVDKISEQPLPPKLQPMKEIILNRGEVLPNNFEFMKKRPDIPIMAAIITTTTTTTTMPPPPPTIIITTTPSPPPPPPLLSVAADADAAVEALDVMESTTTTTTTEKIETTSTTSKAQKPEMENETEMSTELYSANSSTDESESSSTESNTQYLGDILLDLLGGDDSNLTNSEAVDTEPILSRMDEMDLSNDGSSIGVDSPTANSASQEILNFKNIKEYIMATTKMPERPFASEMVAVATAPNINERRAQTSTAIEALDDGEEDFQDLVTAQPSVEIDTQKSIESETNTDESQTSGYVEVETVQYTPVSSWDQPSLFPVQTKWEFINGTLVQTDRAPMKKVFNDTLQAWIVENPQESGERIEPERYIRHNSEEIKNISTIFDTLSSKLGIGPSIPSKTPPFTSFSQNKFREKIGTNGNQINMNNNKDMYFINTPTTRIATSSAAAIQSQAAPTAPTIETTDGPFSPLPILLNPQTENYFSSSAENVFGQAEIEEIDPTQYEQMLLLDKVSSFSHRTSTMPSLVTLLPVKSNTGIRNGMPNIAGEMSNNNNNNNGFLPGSGRGFIQNTQSQKLADTAVVVRTNINVSA